MPRLRILAGSSITNLKPIRANSGNATDVSSDAFEGKVAVYIKNFANPSGKVSDSAYFEHEDRKDVTWSIQVQGRFLKEYTANDILFGNVFDHPLPIPWGFSTILSFMQYIDPTLEQDLTSKSKPWALSPLISTMPHFVHACTNDLHDGTPFPPTTPLGEDTSQLRFQDGERSVELGDSVSVTRRAYFRSSDNRKNVIFGPQDMITTDFCYGYVSFSPTGVALQLPGGFSLDLMRFWDGQPIYFVCCQRASAESTKTGQPIGRIFWCIAIEVLEGEEKSESEEEDEDKTNDNAEERKDEQVSMTNDDVD